MADNEMKRKVLVLDDEDMVGEIACQMLMHLGYETMHVKDGKDAIEEYKKSLDAGEPFNVVIMDLTIPGGMGGQEAVREILALDSSAKVLVSSGYSTDPIMTNFAEYGFTGVVNKPFDLSSIKTAMDSIF